MEEAAENNRYRINPGKIGQELITPLENGLPVLENLPATPPPSSLPALPDEDKMIREARRINPERDEIGYHRTTFIRLISEEAKKDRSIEQVLADYNGGFFLKNIFEVLGTVSRRTFFLWKEKYKKSGVNGLIPNTGREGGSKITNDEIAAVLKHLLHPKQLNIAEGIYQAKKELEEKGIASPSSPDTIRRFVNRVKRERADFWIYYREGKKAADDKIFPYLKRDWSRLKVGDLIIGDGHHANFQIINPFSKDKLIRPKIIWFLDGRSLYPLGFEIAIGESVQAIASALRNSIICLGDIPRGAYLDNSKGFRAKFFTSDVKLEDSLIYGMFDRLGIKTHFAMPYSARSKIIERMFRTFNEQFERNVPSYIGASIKDKPAYMKPNEKFARSMQDPSIPTIDEATDGIKNWVSRYVNTPTRGRDGLRPKDIFEMGKGPGVNVSDLDYLMLGVETRKTHRNGVTFLGKDWFDESLCGLDDQVIIRYSPFDLSRIFVYYKNEFLCEPRPVKKVHPMASESEDPRDMDELNRQRARIRRIKKDFFKFARETTPEALERLPLKEIIHKVPSIPEALEKIESERLKGKFISPFVDDDEFGSETDKPVKFLRDLENSQLDHWQIYDDLKKKNPETWTPKEAEFMEWYPQQTEYAAIYQMGQKTIVGTGGKNG